MQLLKNISAGIRGAFRTLVPTCRDATRLQSAALDARLSVSKRIGLQLHLLICSWCRRYGKHVRFLRQAAHDHPEKLVESTPQNLSAEARERIKKNLRAQSGER